MKQDVGVVYLILLLLDDRGGGNHQLRPFGTDCVVLSDLLCLVFSFSGLAVCVAVALLRCSAQKSFSVSFRRPNFNLAVFGMCSVHSNCKISFVQCYIDSDVTSLDFSSSQPPLLLRVALPFMLRLIIHWHVIVFLYIWSIRP